MHNTLLSADMASWWSLCPGIQIKVVKFLHLNFQAGNQALGNVQANPSKS